MARGRLRKETQPTNAVRTPRRQTRSNVARARPEVQTVLPGGALQTTFQVDPTGIILFTIS